MPQAHFLTRNEVAAALRVSPRRVSRLVKEGLIPPPMKLGPRTERWTMTSLVGHQPDTTNTWDKFVQG